jgi:hypothetical protein
LKSVYIDGDPVKGYLPHPFIPLDGELIIYDPDNVYAYKRFKFGDGKTIVDVLPFSLTSDPNENIIALEIAGTTITYTKADGSTHSFETQDTNTEYFLATDEITGLTKLYSTIGENEDGTMTQKAIKTELDKKVGVTISDELHRLIFTK